MCVAWFTRVTWMCVAWFTRVGWMSVARLAWMLQQHCWHEGTRISFFLVVASLHGRWVWVSMAVVVV